MGPMHDAEPMSLNHLLLRLDGRIDRRTWWLWGVARRWGWRCTSPSCCGWSACRRVRPKLPSTWPCCGQRWPSASKRWHDRGKSGWWVLVALVPLAGWLWVLIENGLLRGDPGRTASATLQRVTSGQRRPLQAA